MAGRGKDAVLPAWMKQGKGVPPAAPGGPTLPPAPHPPAPGSASASRPVSGGVASRWTEHTAPNGRKYYYNSLLGKSSWEKPDELKTAEEKALVGSLSAWKQFTAPDGRKYYYNSATKQSSWDPPPELAASTQAVHSQGDLSSQTGARQQATQTQPQLHQKVYVVPQGAIQVGPTPHYSTNAEAKDAFRTMLNDAAIPSSLSWEDTVLLLAGDKRFGALKTVGERKAAFNEYIQHRRKEEADISRAERLKVKESFFSLLESSESLKDAVRIDPHHKANFTIATDLLSSDPLWKSVEQPRALFEEWVEEKMAEEMERKKLDNRKRRERFARFLKTVEWINVKTSWREAEQRLMGVYEFEELQDDLVGRLEVWQDHMAEVEERDRKDREVRVMEQRRQERMNREAFKSQVLMPHRERGVLHHKMRWREYHAMISGEPALRAVEDNLKGSRPKELFMDVIEELEQEAEEAMVIVDQKLGDLPEERVFEIMDASVSLSCDDFWELLVRHIQEGCRSNSDLKSKLKLEQSSITMRQGVWFECKSRVMRERHRRVERFKDLLRRRMLSNELTLSTTFEEATELCGNDPEWKDVAADDEERKRLFEASLADLKAAEEKKERELVAAEREISKKRRPRRGKHDTYADRDREYNSYSDFSDRSSEDATARREGRGHRRRGYDRKRYRHRRSRSRSRDRGRNRRDGEKRRDRDPHESDREVEEGEVR